MDMTTEALFIQSFIRKDRRERVHFELLSAKKRGAFFNRLSHTYDRILDMTYAQQVPAEIEDPKLVVKYLQQNGSAKIVYAMSSLDAIDGTTLPLGEAVERIFFYGLPSILLCNPGKLCYFQAEQEAGPPPRYFLHRA